MFARNRNRPLILAATKHGCSDEFNMAISLAARLVAETNEQIMESDVDGDPFSSDVEEDELRTVLNCSYGNNCR